MAKTLQSLTVGALLATAVATGGNAQIYAIGSNPQGSLMFSGSAAIAKVASEKLKMQIRVQPMAGSSTYFPLINSGELDFGLANVDDTVTGYNGTGAYEGKPNKNVRVMGVIFPLTLSMIVVNDGPIKSVKDLKGMRVPANYIGQITGRVMQDALLASAGLTMADVKPVPALNLFQGIDALGEGKVDVATTGPAVGQVQQANIALSSRGGVRFLNIDSSPQALAAMRKYAPVRTIVVEPAPHNVGVIAPTTFMAYSVYLTTNDKLPNDVAYKMVKMLHESYADLTKVTPVLNRFEPERMTEEVSVPWHPGAVKFFSEIGQWPPKS
jgi:TRAP transporter TAXI family solute receptor